MALGWSDTVASYARAMQSSIESVDKYALWVEDQERAEAKQRLEDTLNRILETYPAAEVECDGCCEECDVEDCDDRTPEEPAFDWGDLD